MNSKFKNQLDKHYNIARIIRGMQEESLYTIIGFDENSEPKRYDLRKTDPDDYIKYLAYLIGVGHIESGMIIADMDVVQKDNKSEEIDIEDLENKTLPNLVGLVFDRTGLIMRFSSHIESCILFSEMFRFNIFIKKLFDGEKTNENLIFKEMISFAEETKSDSELGYVSDKISNSKASTNMPDFENFTNLVVMAEVRQNKLNGVVEWNDWN